MGRNWRGAIAARINSAAFVHYRQKIVRFAERSSGRQRYWNMENTLEVTKPRRALLFVLLGASALSIISSFSLLVAAVVVH